MRWQWLWETRELALGDEFPKTSHRLVLQVKQVQGWQHYLNGSVIEHISDEPCQRSRNPQRLHARRSSKHLVWSISSRQFGCRSHVPMEMAHVGGHSGRLAEHIGQVRNLPL